MEMEIGARYRFNTRSPAFLSTTVDEASFAGKINYSMALTLSPNIASRHASIYPTLPAGSPRSPDLLQYYIFQMKNGTREIFAESWIDLSTVEKIVSVSATVRFEEISLEDIEKIRIALTSAGLKNFTITRT